jgi:hypothetical protein
MEYLIQLKIKIDEYTSSVSDLCSRGKIRKILLFIKWSAVGFICLDFYMHSVYTGDFILFSTVFIIAVTSLLTKNKKPIEIDSTKEPDCLPVKSAVRKSHCEKCGVKVKINYGNAYHTLCKKCT